MIKIQSEAHPVCPAFQKLAAGGKSLNKITLTYDVVKVLKKAEYMKNLQLLQSSEFEMDC